jgi:predicted RNase H-like HicB family nuclease
VTREGDWYVARYLEIEVTSQGETVEQALDNLRDVVEVYLEEERPPRPRSRPWSPRSTCASRHDRPAAPMTRGARRLR